MTSLPRIGVIIPVFNRPNLVCATLHAVLAQTHPPTQVLVIDDGSTDDTAARVAEVTAAHPDRGIVLLEQANAGAGAARNHGIARLDPAIDAVAFLDSDDVWPDDFLARTAAILAGDSAAVAVSADRLMQEIDRGTSELSSSAPLAASPWRFFVMNGAGVGSCTLFRRSAIGPGEGFPEDVPTGQDTVMFLRLAGRGGWRHAPGAPVTMTRSFAQTHAGEDDHLHRRYADYYIWWAKMSELCLAQAPERLRAEPAIAARMRTRWAEARDQALGNRDYGTALRCAIRGLRYLLPR